MSACCSVWDIYVNTSWDFIWCSKGRLFAIWKKCETDLLSQITLNTLTAKILIFCDWTLNCQSNQIIVFCQWKAALWGDVTKFRGGKVQFSVTMKLSYDGLFLWGGCIPEEIRSCQFLGSFSSVRFKFRSAAFWRQNVRLVRIDNCLSFRSAVDKLLQLKMLNNQEIWKWKKKHLPVALIKLLCCKNLFIFAFFFVFLMKT